MMEFKKMSKLQLMEYVLLNMKHCPFNLNREDYEKAGWNFDAYFASLVRKQASMYKKDYLVMLAENISNVVNGIRIC